MKLDPNTEIDRLLLHHARHGGAATPFVSVAADERGNSGGGSEEMQAEHLDVDEMSAYAENALPDAARARYISHLADCDSCRKMVTELVMSSGAANALVEKKAVLTPTVPARSWRERFAWLLAPQTLRYAASVLVLAGIASIAFIVLRGGRDAKFSSQEEQTQNSSYDQNSNRPPEQGVQSGSSTTIAPALTPQGSPAKPDATGTPLDAQKDNQAQPEQANAPKTMTEQGPAESSPAPVVTGDALGGNNERARDEDAVSLARQQPAPPAPSVSTVKNEADGKDLSGRASGNENNMVLDSSTSSTTAEVAENKPQSSAKERAAGARAKTARREAAPASQAAGSEAKDDGGEREDKAKKAEATRRVGGREFVRRGGVWVDTAYKSQATTNVKRGSEQYRALSADEPGLRSIADQLGGTSIIIWKGRAYKIY